MPSSACQPLTLSSSVYLVSVNSSHVYYGCRGGYRYFNGDYYQSCDVNGTWTGQALQCTVDSVMPKTYLVILIVGATIAIFVACIPYDFYRFRKRKKKVRDHQERLSLVTRIAPSHATVIHDSEMNAAKSGTDPPRRFNLKSLFSVFRFVGGKLKTTNDSADENSGHHHKSSDQVVKNKLNRQQSDVACSSGSGSGSGSGSASGGISVCKSLSFVGDKSGRHSGTGISSDGILNSTQSTNCSGGSGGGGVSSYDVMGVCDVADGLKKNTKDSYDNGGNGGGNGGGGYDGDWDGGSGSDGCHGNRAFSPASKSSVGDSIPLWEEDERSIVYGKTITSGEWAMGQGAANHLFTEDEITPPLNESIAKTTSDDSGGKGGKSDLNLIAMTSPNNPKTGNYPKIKTSGVIGGSGGGGSRSGNNNNNNNDNDNANPFTSSLVKAKIPPHYHPPQQLQKMKSANSSSSSSVSKKSKKSPNTPNTPKSASAHRMGTTGAKSADDNDDIPHGGGINSSTVSHHFNSAPATVEVTSTHHHHHSPNTSTTPTTPASVDTCRDTDDTTNIQSDSTNYTHDDNQNNVTSDGSCSSSSSSSSSSNVPYRPPPPPKMDSPAKSSLPTSSPSPKLGNNTQERSKTSQSIGGGGDVADNNTTDSHSHHSMPAISDAP